MKKLLYDCEAWYLTKILLDRLCNWHSKKLREMCRVTLFKSWQHHISNNDLQARLNIQSIGFYIASRTLRWLIHVAHTRNPYRLPRLILTIWIQSLVRQEPAPLMTYGRTYHKQTPAFLRPSHRCFRLGRYRY